MERPLPFQPPDPRQPAGWALSLGLHLLLVLAALIYVMQRPILPAQQAILPVELVSVFPAPAPQPATRPGSPAPAARTPRPAAVPPPQASAEPAEDALDARLQALSQLRAPDGPLALGNGPGGRGTGGGGGSLADFIRAQIMRRWMPNLTNRQRREQPVRLRVVVTDKGELAEVTILDRQEFDGNLLYRSMAIGARNAALLSSPIAMPQGPWPKTTVLTITLNPADASR
jgi:outer membrane biosynthesis protein TonB